MERRSSPATEAESSAMFVALWRGELPRLRAFCLRRCSGTAADPDEVLSATAIRAWRAFPTLHEPDRFGAWSRRIAEREASRARRSRQAALVAESAHHLESSIAGAATEADIAASPVSLVAITREAGAAGYLSLPEATVVAGRLASPEHDKDWEAVSAASGLTREACALHWIRAVPKLRLYLLLAHPEAVGGRAALVAAFAGACRDPRRPLTPLEAEAFRHEVIERRKARRQPGWAEALRGAAAKVMRHLRQPLF